MSARTLLAELDATGISVTREGDNLRVRGNPGVSITPDMSRIKAHKPALLAALHVRERIVTAASVERSLFDRDHYDALWAEWYAHESGKG